jgi:hypothetical protein
MALSSGDLAQFKPGSGGAGDLLALLRGQPIEGFERSFKMSAGSLLGDRYLLGVQRNALPDAVLLDICQHIQMPRGQLAAMQESLPRASTVHFGFEQSEASGTHKVYLEFASALDPVLRTGDAALLHIAYKWDMANPRNSTIAKYLCYPDIVADELVGRHAALYSDRAGDLTVTITREILDLALRRAGGRLMYLEVSEQGNPRRSFDVNLHEAGLFVEDIEPCLYDLRQHYGISPEQFDPMFALVRRARLAHLSGGINRHGKDFVTVYYEADAL